MGISIKKVAAIVLIIILLIWAFMRTVSKPVYNFETLPKVEGLNGVRIF